MAAAAAVEPRIGNELLKAELEGKKKRPWVLGLARSVGYESVPL
jgi:hypothetical protein